MMTRRGRKPLGPRHVQHLSGSQQAKQRLQVILRTMDGELSIAEACDQLGIGESRFHALRNAWLQQALDLLEPRPLGRPVKDHSLSRTQVEQLQAENEQLRQELVLVQVRAELAAALPHVAEDAPAAEKKIPPAKLAWKRKRRRKRR